MSPVGKDKKYIVVKTCIVEEGDFNDPFVLFDSIPEAINFVDNSDEDDYLYYHQDSYELIDANSNIMVYLNHCFGHCNITNGTEDELNKKANDYFKENTCDNVGFNISNVETEKYRIRIYTSDDFTCNSLGEFYIFIRK